MRPIKWIKRSFQPLVAIVMSLSLFASGAWAAVDPTGLGTTLPTGAAHNATPAQQNTPLDSADFDPGASKASSTAEGQGAPAENPPSVVQRLKPALVLAGGLLLTAGALAARVIGDGGGEIEMRALSFAADLPHWFRFCAQPGNPCDLSHFTFRMLVAAMVVAPSSAPPTVEFVYSDSEPIIVDRQQKILKVLVASSDIEMRKRLLDAFVSWYDVSLLARDGVAQELMDRIFADSETLRQESAIDSRWNLVNFLLPDSIVPTIQYQQSSDFTDWSLQLSTAVRCPATVRWTSVQILIRQEHGFVVEASGVCQDQPFLAKIFVAMKSDEVTDWSLRSFAMQNTDRPVTTRVSALVASRGNSHRLGTSLGQAESHCAGALQPNRSNSTE